MTYFDKYAQDLIVTEELGASLPANEFHAVSVSLPLWEHVVGYEEGKREVTSLMRCGYPRFRINDAVLWLFTLLKCVLYLQDHSDLAGICLDGQERTNCVSVMAVPLGCFALPGYAVALRMKQFLQADEVGPAYEEAVSVYRLLDTGVFCVFFPERLAAKAKTCWQHSGEVLSSRLAEQLLLRLQERGCVLAEGDEAQGRGFLAHQGTVLRLSSPGSIGVPLLQRADASSASSSSHSMLACSPAPSAAELAVARRVAEALGEDAHEHVQLTVSGMAAIFTAHLLLKRLLASSHSGGGAASASGLGLGAAEDMQVVVWGFPYLDTLKIMQRREWSGGVHFLGLGDDEDLRRLEELLARGLDDQAGRNSIGAIFTEFPSNPLLRCPPLGALGALARRYKVRGGLVVDDTLGSFANLDLLQCPEVTVLVSSLTKIFSGRGDVLAGSLVLNRRSPVFAEAFAALRELRDAHQLAWICEHDALALESNSRDYAARLQRCCASAAQLHGFLSRHRLVQHVFYAADSPEYARFMRSGDSAGFGYVLSLQLRGQCDVRAFYDALRVNKGPSLGTHFTLACPYTLLAHYTELDWAAQFGVHRDLVRVSVGLEDFEVLKEVFSSALETSAHAAAGVDRCAL